MAETLKLKEHTFEIGSMSARAGARWAGVSCGIVAKIVGNGGSELEAVSAFIGSLDDKAYDEFFIDCLKAVSIVEGGASVPFISNKQGHFHKVAFKEQPGVIAHLVTAVFAGLLKDFIIAAELTKSSNSDEANAAQ